MTSPTNAKTSMAGYWIALAVLLAAVYGSFTVWRSTQPAVVPEISRSGTPPATKTTSTAVVAAPGPIAPFKLTDQDGNEFDSQQLDGKVWVASFFFTNCPAICWRMNQALAAWQQSHPDSKIRFVSITCDPDNDTPEALKKYADHFKADPARWTFLTGSMKDIQRIGQESFRVAVVQGDHSDRACVVDSNGQVRGQFRLTEPDQAELLDRLLTVVESEPIKEEHKTAGSDSTLSPASPDSVAPADGQGT